MRNNFRHKNLVKEALKFLITMILKDNKCMGLMLLKLKNQNQISIFKGMRGKKQNK